jgi:hypothetical protein
MPFSAPRDLEATTPLLACCYFWHATQQTDGRDGGLFGSAGRGDYMKMSI